MTTELTQLLDHLNYESRPQQVKLYELLTAGQKGIIVQAGTGVGKSIAVLAAAANRYRETSVPSVIVTPTNILLEQYMRSDAPAAAEAFGVEVTELRGKRWYYCAKSAPFGIDGKEVGCLTKDSGCSLPKWELAHGLRDAEPDDEAEEPYECGYQEAKHNAGKSAIVVTNTDMLIVNDRLVPQPFFSPEGALFIDEAHQLEDKLKGYAARSIQAKELVREYEDTGKTLARYLENFQEQHGELDGPYQADVVRMLKACWSRGPRLSDATKRPSDRGLEIQEAIYDIVARMTAAEPNPNCVVWSDGWSLKMDWVDVSAAAKSLLTERPSFALVSATIPDSMPAALGVKGVAKVADVGHPFNYREQATLGISERPGSYKYATPKNVARRAQEVQDEVVASKGGALLLFSSFKDLDAVYGQIAAKLRAEGLTVLRQNDPLRPDQTNAELAQQFKDDGSAVLFGSESFATGFDVPGDALRLVVIFKLPYPGQDPVIKRLTELSFKRYQDMMLTKIVQAAGRLIRTEQDRGRLFIADSRAEDILDPKALMLKHLSDFRREELA
jgi:Rad3-related DNA helicase